MLRLIVQRLLALLPLLFIVSVLTFSFTSLLPSDPVDLIIGDTGTQEQYEMVRERLGLNEPVVVRYFQWLGKAVQGDRVAALQVYERFAGRLRREHQASPSRETTAIFERLRESPPA